MLLRDLLDIAEYNEMVEEGYISVRKHAKYDLFISNYTPKTQYEQRWNRSTMLSRGLITDAEDNIIARPWAKFFNLGEQYNGIQYDEPVEVMDKLDGSLGILYPCPDGTWGIATRGSFHSEQAEHATALFNSKYADDHNFRDNIFTVKEDVTLLFEIIYPANRIVLDYGDMDDLVLLGAVYKDYGYYYGPIAAQAMTLWSGPVAEVFHYNTLSEALGHTDRANAEGFVVRSHNTLVKIKQPDYLELHRLRFNMTPKRIWQALADGEDLDALVASMPDEFQDEIKATAGQIKWQFSKLSAKILVAYEKIKHKKPANRREFAELALKTQYAAPLFTLADGGTIDSYVWKQIKPRGDRGED